MPKLMPEVRYARGARLRQVRDMMGLSRLDIEEKYGINASTLRGWEDAIASTVSDKNVKLLLPVFEGEGMQCSIGWLLHGEGTPPILIKDAIIADQRKYEPDVAVAAELELFCKHNANAMYIQVADDGMEPYYHEGDFVAGERLYHQAIHAVIGQRCIVETQRGEKFLRLLRAGSKPGYYGLHCLNSETLNPTPTLYDIQLLSAAPVIWHRRVLPTVG